MEQQPKVVTEYLELLNDAQEVMTKQKDCIKAAIKLRMFNEHVVILLNKINTSGNLTDIIATINQLTHEFDTLAVAYGPYPKEAYTKAIKDISDNG